MTHEVSRFRPDDPRDVAARIGALAAEFPGHYVAAEHAADHGIRYIAGNRHAHVHPRLVVTRDLAELRAALGAGTRSRGKDHQILGPGLISEPAAPQAGRLSSRPTSHKPHQATPTPGE
jgi:hypothetical protein